MLQKIIAVVLISVLLLGQFTLPVSVHAVPTDGLASTWTREKAEHLARRVLFYPTPQEVDNLYTAGSATAGVDILFPSVGGPSRTAYNNALVAFTGGSWYTAHVGNNNFGWGSSQWNMQKYFLFSKYADPYQAKAKLATVFEDIYSVNVYTAGLNFSDVYTQHQLLYNNTLGNYKTLVKRLLHNNPMEAGDFAASQFLNLLNQGPLNPNENYPREMLQLFLMGEYLPGESQESGNTRNYSEADVASLARILTGFWADLTTVTINDIPQPRTVFYTGAYHNTMTGITFLPGNTGGVNFPFYNSSTDLINVDAIGDPILGNAGLSDNAVDYIFAKKSYPIAMFLADKLFNFYVHESPTRQQLDATAAEILANDFDMFDSVKWLLVQDFMYSDESMNGVVYANPLELAVGIFRVLHATDGNIYDTKLIDDGDILSRLGWTPYIPGSIFGRDGFDTNKKWMNPYILTQWTNFATTVTYDYTRSGSYLVDSIAPQTMSGASPITMDAFIDQVEDNILLGRSLPLSLRNTIKTYLTHSEDGTPIPFEPTNTAYRNVKYPGVYALVLSQPEFMLKSGYDLSELTTPSEPTALDTATGTLIVVELPGGYDWMHGIVQKDDYADYVAFRDNGTNDVATDLSELVDLGDYYMNNWLAYSGGVQANGMGLKTLYDQGHLKLFNRVGVSNHSRDHDQAQFQAASMTTSRLGGKGILGALSEFEDDSSKVFIMGNRQPNIVQGGNYINLGSSDNRIAHSNPGNRLSTDQRNQVVGMIMGTFTGRTYPGRTGLNYLNSVVVHDIANLSVAQGGQAGVGNTTATQLTFLEHLLDNNLGQAFYLANSGNGYDTHADQLIGGSSLNTGVNRFISSLTSFFLSVKDTHNVTIVVFSEFGRTNKVNGTNGTDHGNGGGTIVISSNPEVLSGFSDSHIFGQMRAGKERADWLSPGIDQRTIYGKIFDAIYGIPEGTFFPGFTRTLAQELSLEPGVAPLLHTTFRSYNDNRAMPTVRFKLDGENFNLEKGSYATFRAFVDSGWRDYISSFKNIVNYNGYSRLTETQNSEGFYSVDSSGYDGFWSVVNNNNEGTSFVYELTPVTDQYIENTYTGTMVIPQVLAFSNNSPLSTEHSVLRRYHETAVPTTGTIIAGSGIILSSTGITFADQGNLRIRTNTGTTYITHLTSSGTSRLWNGGFIIGERMSNPGFIPEEARLVDDNVPLSNFTLSNTVRFGADVLGVGMELSQPVEIVIGDATAGNDYYVFTSEDGYSWTRQAQSPITANGSGEVVFSTDHFSLFTLASATAVPVCSLGASSLTVSNGSSVNLNWSTFGADSVSISNGVGVLGLSGSVSVTPPPSSSTTYILTATNTEGTSTCQVTVQSTALPSCTIISADTLVKNGISTTLTWTGTNVTSAVLQPLGSVVPGTANMSVTPPPSATTNYSVNVTNAVGTSSCNTSVTTYANTAPVAVNDTFNVAQNGNAEFPVLQNDTDVDMLDVLVVSSIIGTPTHGTAEISGAGIRYTPVNGYCGTDSFTYASEDQDGGISNMATVSVNVSCGVNPPTTVDMNFSTNEDGTISGSLVGSDLDGDILTYIATADVTQGNLNLMSNGSFLYTPDANFAGTDVFTFYAYDGTFSGNTSTATFTINPVNDLPIALPDVASTNQDSSTYIDILTNDTDLDHQPSTLIINISPSPGSGSVIQTGSTLFYTPNPGYCGTDSFGYSVTDGSGGISNATTVSVDIVCIIPGNSAPTALPDTASGTEDSVIAVDFITNDTDPDFTTGSDTISFQNFVTLPSNGTVVVTSSGSATTNRSSEVFSYTPNTNYCGTDSFTYRVYDTLGVVSNTAVVNITISCINDAPTVTSISRTGYADMTYTGILTVTDVDSSTFIYQLVDPISLIYGTASIMPDGTYTYMPLSSTASVIDTLYYTATDSLGGVSNTGSIVFTLTAPVVVINYTGGTLVSTGSAQILTGVTLSQGETLNLNGSSITSSSSSGSTGSIVLPGTIDIIVDSGTWTGDILAPEKLSSNDSRNITLGDAGVAATLPANTSMITYSYTPVDTYKAGSETAALALTGGLATIEFVVDRPGVVFGSRLQILRSQDGITWEANQPDTFCIVDNELKCTFRTNHLTYFGTVQQLSTPVLQPAVSIGPGGGYYAGAGFTSSVTSGFATGTGLIGVGVVPTKDVLRARGYINWIAKYESQYPEKFLAQRVYWDILRHNTTIKSRTNAVDALVKEAKSLKDDSILDITLIVNTLWKAKLSWTQKYKMMKK